MLRVEGAIAYVDDDGFETPVRTAELVVVLPAGHKPDTPGRKMFDQKAFDVGRSDFRAEPEPEPEPVRKPAPEPEEFPIEETEYGDDMTLVIAFEPEDVKKLADTKINALFVNDSNYFIDYQLLVRDGEAGWKTEAKGSAAPNELVELATYTQQSVRCFERFVFQALASKRDKAFEIKMPLSVSRKVDMTKFYKLHCFRPTTYFDTPVLEVPVIAETPRPAKNTSKETAKNTYKNPAKNTSQNTYKNPAKDTSYKKR